MAEHSVLIAHAPRSGSARRAGELVAATLAAHGLDVELRPADRVETVGRYGAVVLGGPVHLGRWHRASRRFLRRHRRALARVPVAVFATETRVPPAGDGELERALLDVPELEPIAAARFPDGGRGLRLHRGESSDPEQISRWAEKVARELGA